MTTRLFSETEFDDFLFPQLSGDQSMASLFGLDNIEAPVGMPDEEEGLPDYSELGHPIVRPPVFRSNIRARSWVFTFNNYTEDDVAKLKNYPCRYLVFGRELAPRTGTPHLQGYFTFKNAKAMNTLVKEFPGCWFQVARGTATQNRTYCSKDSDFVEIGECPSDAKQGSEKGGEANKQRYIDFIEAARDQTCDQFDYDRVDPQLTIRHYGTWLKIREMEQRLPDDLDDVCGLWYVGASGTGKTHKSRAENPGSYNKLPNKWWDGYKNHEVAILQDLDKNEHKWMAYHLKIWADKYAFSAEIKGGALTLRPKKFIVTSNYFPEEIWDRSTDLEPIKRRFKVVYFYRDEIDTSYHYDESIKVTFGNIMDTVQT